MKQWIVGITCVFFTFFSTAEAQENPSSKNSSGQERDSFAQRLLTDPLSLSTLGDNEPRSTKNPIVFPENPESSRLTLIGVANLTVASRSTGSNVSTSGTGFYSAYRLDDDNKIKFELAVDAFGAPYRYFWYQNSHRSDHPYDWNAVIDELTFSFYGFRVGKQRFKIEGPNPIPFAENGIILQDVNFGRMGVSYRKDFENGSFLHAGIFESRDGEFDMRLRSEGVMLGAHGQWAASEKLNLRGAYVYDEFGRGGYARQMIKVGADYNIQEWLKLWASGYSLENDPFGNESDWAAEGGVICKINEQYAAGLTVTCEDRDKNQYLLHGEYAPGNGLIFKIWAGAEQFDSSYERAGFVDDEWGWTIGTSVDLTQQLNGVVRGVRNLFGR